MKAIITAAMVISMCLSTVNSHAADKQNETQKIEFRYAYDEQGRLANKEMLSWDEATQQWQKSSRLTYKYYKNGYNVEVSEWNANKQTYDIPSQVTLYRSQAPNLTSVKIYKMNETRDNMYLTSRTVMMEPLNANLLASK
jgi:hypothetical protein